MSSAALRPGLARGSYPERRDRDESRSAGILGLLRRSLGRRARAGAGPERFVAAVEARAPLLREEGGRALAERVAELGRGLRRTDAGDDVVAECFAVVREAARRSLSTPHYDVQLLAGWGMARGMLVEMETGEGKTLAATLPACAAALAGVPVHVISANEYLVERDARELEPLYRELGLSVAAVREGDRDPAMRRRAYGCHVVYATAKQLAFDYLRDGGVRRRNRGDLVKRLERVHRAGRQEDEVLLRGLCCAIVDEADHVLIDEARTPLVLAGPGRAGDPSHYRRALRLAASLREGTEFRVDRARGSVELRRRGRERLAELARPLPGWWSGPRRREEQVLRALRALHLLVRDRDYLVRAGRIQIIDGPTGRVSEDRSWEMGMHQLLETKEECALTPEQETLARISYQQFFRRYLRLSGTTGTAGEVASELWQVYGLDTLRVPTRLASRRRPTGGRLFARQADRSQALVASVEAAHRRGRPVLVGTWSLAASQRVSEILTRAGLPNQLLNAAQDDHEAQVVAEAGTRGRITVATQMAGRGTDIRLGPGVAELGGLHVVCAGVSAARRLDRQLWGRCARQGDPGSYESIACLEDDPLELYFPKGLLAWLAGRTAPGRCLPPWLGKALTRMPQLAEERRHARARRALVHLEEHLGDLLAFAGPGE